MKLIIAFILLFILILMIYVWLKSNQIGADGAASQRLPYESSPQFDRERGRFHNQIVVDFEKNMDFKALLKAYIFGPQIRTPKGPLPPVKPDFQAWQGAQDLRWIWLGHSSIYMHLGLQKILIDPVLHAASPVPFAVRRFESPAAKVSEWPEPDVIVLSHDHYDHLDAKVMRDLARGTCIILAPLGVKTRLLGWGISNSRIKECDWGDRITVGDITYIATPAQHFSGRGLNDRNKTLWCGWVIEGYGRKVFYSGDSGYAPHFKEIGAAYGPFDIGFMESGQYNEMWRYVHLMPEDVIAASLDLGLKDIFPVHWGMFNLSIHDWFEPIERVTRLSEKAGIQVWASRVGDLSKFGGDVQFDAWWREHGDFKKRGHLVEG